MPNLISVSEAAARIGCSRSHVYNLIAAGRLPRYDIGITGSKTRLLDSDLDAYIERAHRPIPIAS